MSTATAIAVPLEGPSSNATEYQALQFLVLQRLLRVQTAALVRVQAVAGGGAGPVGTVDVLPLVGQIDGAGNLIPHVTIYGRPYLRQQGGTNAVILDPQVGDLGLMVFCARDISNVIASGEPSPPASLRVFDWADGLYVGGALNGTPQNYLEIAPNGAISAVSTQSITLQAPQITLSGAVNANGAQISTAGEVSDASGVVLGTHPHSGVETGSSNSGPPVPA